MNEKSAGDKDEANKSFQIDLEEQAGSVCTATNILALVDPRSSRRAARRTCVALSRAAGGVLLGKTVTTEFASRIPLGETANPHNPLHTPGGSSSGSAAAVADFM